MAKVRHEPAKTETKIVEVSPQKWVLELDVDEVTELRALLGGVIRLTRSPLMEVLNSLDMVNCPGSFMFDTYFEESPTYKG